MTTAAEATAPWISPGDRLLRRDIELLKAYGIIKGPINTWPLSWKQVQRGLATRDRDRVLPGHVQAALRRVEAQGLTTDANRGVDVFSRVSLTNEERLIRDFDGGGREDVVDVSAGFEKLFKRAYVRFEVGYRQDDPISGDLNFDGSVLAYTLGNWIVFGGFQDQWYGPGFDTGLLLSTNARPFPRIGFQRLDPKPINFPVLRWLGPVQFNFVAGRAETSRTDFANNLLLLMRLEIEPLRNFSIAFSRGIQLCGQDRPCDIEIFARAIVAGSDLDNTGTLDEPGNQIAGIDLNYAFLLGGFSWRSYLEISFEDSDGPVTIDDVAFTAGGSVTGFLEKRLLTWTLRGEVTDTQANRFFGLGTNSRPGVTYNQFIYTDGYTFRDRFLGASIGGDGRLFTGELSVIDKRSWLYYLRYRHAVINGTNLAAPFFNTFGLNQFVNQVSDNREEINFVEAGIFLPPTRFGRFGLEGRVQDDSPNTPGSSGLTGAVELNWSINF